MSGFPAIPGYKIERELGQGGMARVYLAHEEKLERQVALKVLLPALAEEESVTQRFLKEAKTAARLRHSNIVSIYDVGKAGNTYYFAMEYLEESLKDRIQRSKGIPASDALALVRAIASALDYAHREQLLHRDIKPDNIMFRLDGTPVLADFGIAKAVDSQTKLTKTGMSIGTPHYMSPEQIRGFELDGRADLYSLGIVLFEMLTGKVPFDATDTIAVCMKHVQEPVPKLEDSVGAQLAVPSKLALYQPLIDKLLAKDPKDRLQSGKELIQQIDALNAAVPGQISPHIKSSALGFDSKTERKAGSSGFPGKEEIGVGRNEMIGKPIFSESSPPRKMNPLVVYLTAALAMLVVLLILFLGGSSEKKENNGAAIKSPTTPALQKTLQGEPIVGYPKLIDYVNDFAKVIDPGSLIKLRKKCVDLQNEKGVQLVIATIGSIQDFQTGDASLEGFAANLFNVTGIGDKDKNNGLLILVSMKERIARLEFGLGYEKDGSAFASATLDEMTPYFKKSLYGEGLLRGVQYIGQRIEQQRLGAPLGHAAQIQKQNGKIKESEKLKSEVEAAQEQNLGIEDRRLKSQKKRMYTIQVGVFYNENRAQDCANEFINLGYLTEIYEIKYSTKILFAVCAGKFANLNDATKEKQKLENLKSKRFKIKFVENVRFQPTDESKSSEKNHEGNLNQNSDEENKAGEAQKSIENLESSENLQQAIRISSVQRPRKIKEVKPIYSQIALASRIQGVVIIEAMTDIYGRARQARIINGHPLLNEAALSTVRQWVYEPYILNGIPKPVIFTTTVTFTLQDQ